MAFALVAATPRRLSWWHLFYSLLLLLNFQVMAVDTDAELEAKLDQFSHAVRK